MCEATITGSTYILDRSSRSDLKVEHPVQPVINFSRSSTASLSSGSNVLLENCQDIASSHKPLERSSTLNDMSVFNMPSSYQNCMVHIVKSTSVASTQPDVQPLIKESHLTLSCQVKSFDVSCHNIVESVKSGAGQGASSNAHAGMDISKYPVVSSNLLINISAPNPIGKTCSSLKQMMPIPKSLKAISVVTLPSLSSAPHYVVEGLSSSNVYPYIQLVKIVNISTSGQLTCSGPVKVVPIKSFPVFVGSTPALSSKVFQHEAHCGKEADSPSPDSSSSSGQLFKSAGCGIYTVTNNARVTATSASGRKSKKSYLQGLLSTNPTWCLSGSMCSLERPPLSNQKPSEMFGIASCSAMSGTKLVTSIQSSSLHPSLVSENAAIKKSEMPCKAFSARNKGRIDFHKPEQLVTGQAPLMIYPPVKFKGQVPAPVASSLSVNSLTSPASHSGESSFLNKSSRLQSAVSSLTTAQKISLSSSVHCMQIPGAVSQSDQTLQKTGQVVVGQIPCASHPPEMCTKAATSHGFSVCSSVYSTYSLPPISSSTLSKGSMPSTKESVPNVVRFKQKNSDSRNKAQSVAGRMPFVIYPPEKSTKQVPVAPSTYPSIALSSGNPLTYTRQLVKRQKLPCVSRKIPSKYTPGQFVARETLRWFGAVENLKDDVWKRGINELRDWVRKFYWNVKIDERCVINNLTYIIQVLGKHCDYSIRKELQTVVAKYEGCEYAYQYQGSSSFCGLCTLNNTVGFTDSSEPVFTVEDLDQAADYLWIKQATEVQSLDADLSHQRSLSGDYNATVLEYVVERKGYQFVRKDNIFINFFRCLPVHSLSMEVACVHYLSLLDLLQLGAIKRVCLCLKNQHYVTVVFKQTGIILLDSLKPYISVLNVKQSLLFIKEYCAKPGFGSFALSYGQNKDLKQIDAPFIDLTNSGESVPGKPCPYLSYHAIWEDESICEEDVVSNSVCTVTVHDLRSLRFGVYVNDVIINFVRLYINSQVQFTYIVDPLTVEKIFKDGPTSITRKVVPPGMKKILLPVIDRESSHWYLLAVETEREVFGEFNTKNFAKCTRSVKAAVLAWLQTQGYKVDLKVMNNQEHSEIPSQGSNTTECGIFLICVMVSLSIGLPFSFTVYDMDEARMNLGRILTGYLGMDYLLTERLWKGEMDDLEEVKKYLREPEAQDDDVNLLENASIEHAMGLNDNVERYMHQVSEQYGKKFRTTFYHVSFKEEDFVGFERWRDNEEARNEGRLHWLKLNLLVRKWLKEESQLMWEQPVYFGKNWVLVSYGELMRFDNWKNRLRQTLLADELDEF